MTFDTARVNVPKYIRELPEYNGGVAIQYLTDDKENIIRQDGYVARRWDSKVAERFHLLISELGKHFDGKIEGVNFPETAVGFGDSGKLYPEGFTPEGYRNAILKQMKAGKKAFQNSVVLQYANFMPGEWLPWEDKGYLESLYQFAKEHNIAMGGPDIKIYKKAQINHSYKFLKTFSDDITTGVAVQWGNYEEINPKTARQVSIEEIHTFGKEEVGLDYIFWCTQEPFYSEHLHPYLEKQYVAYPVQGVSELYKTLYTKDSLLFNVGFNQCDITVFERLVSENFEFYHDQSGVTSSKATFIDGTRNGLCKLDYQPLRALVKGSLEAFPL